MQKAYSAPHNRENLSSKSMQSYFILARKSKAPSCKSIKFPCLCNKLQKSGMFTVAQVQGATLWALLEIITHNG